MSVFQDKRTFAQKRQQELFQQLGTITRTRINIGSIASSGNLRLHLTFERELALVAAYNVLLDMEKHIKLTMQNLPNKKRLAALGKKAP